MQVVKNESQQQYEMELEDGSVAFVEYVLKGDKVYLTHTEVPKSHQGKGVASQLVGQALEIIKSENKTLVPLCSYVSKYVNNHQEWHSLLSDGYQM